MSDELLLLVTVADFDARQLLRCALRIPNGLNHINTEYLREDEALIRRLLPPHVASVGPIVDIEEIFSIADGEIVIEP